MRKKERESLPIQHTPHLERDTRLLRSLATLRSGSLFAPYFALCASPFYSTSSTLSRPFAISKDEASSSSNTLFIDSLRPRGRHTWMYVGNHHTSTFLSLGQHSLCDTTPIYNRRLLQKLTVSSLFMISRTDCVVVTVWRRVTANFSLILCNI